MGQGRARSQAADRVRGSGSDRQPAPSRDTEIKTGDGGKLCIEGEMVVPIARDFHKGGFKAQVVPQTISSRREK
jgi:hypothetical protein